MQSIKCKINNNFKKLSQSFTIHGGLYRHCCILGVVTFLGLFRTISHTFDIGEKGVPGIFMNLIVYQPIYFLFHFCFNLSWTCNYALHWSPRSLITLNKTFLRFINTTLCFLLYKKMFWFTVFGNTLFFK